jgi:hypothetical protein
VAVVITVTPTFGGCPECREDFDMVVDILYTATDLELELESYGFDFDKVGNGIYDIQLPCGGILTVKWEDDLGDITAFSCGR